MGNLLLHLCGNITQYIIAALGENLDLRERDKEFETVDGYTKNELWQQLEDTVNKAKEVLENASDKKLLKKHKVQGFYFSGIGIVIHAVEHFSYHTGQIAFCTKQLKNTDLGFYKDHNLNTKNE